MSENGRRSLYCAAGIYLIYLGARLVWQFLKKTGGNPTVSIVGGVVFLIAGIFLVVNYILYRKRMFSQKNEEKEIEEIESKKSEE